MNSLKVLNLATHDHGGAGVASVCINNLLIRAGFDSKLMVWEKKGDENNIFQCRLYSRNPISSKMYRKWVRSEDRRWQKVVSDYGFIQKTVFDPQSSYVSAKSILSQTGFIPDLILLHWVSFFMTSSIVSDLKKITGAKIAWLMMDNSPITGGCHYPFKCNGYQLECQDCPMFKVRNTMSQNILSSKLKLLPEDLEFWGTSSDVLRAEKSALGKLRNARTMIFPIDDTLISNDSREKVRGFWGLPMDRKIILVGCADLSDIRKGGEYLLSALILLKVRYPELCSDISLLLVGDYQSDIFENIGYDVYTLGRLSLSELMRVYNGVDFFLSTSVEDSGPLMINQSIAAGTPVVSFDIGVANDLVVSGYTGFKAQLRNVDDLLHCIVEMLSKLEESTDELYANCKELYARKTSSLSLLSCVDAIMSKK